MILAVHHLSQTRSLRDSEDVLRSFDEAFEYHPGEEVHAQATWLVFEEEGASVPVSMLEVSANLENGLGGVVWFAGWNDANRFKENPEDLQDDLGEYFWVSDVEKPPAFDPEVISDHDSALYFDPRGVLPVTEIRSVVEEFSQLMGNRPTRISWLPGRQDGSRLS
ncbi:Imm1 family immunity protein [Streptomyces sp. DSS69]|uniref:Imm1 family immunity protein n=1 Tax=Streptomyces sp. DSS69 TaxID=3113369 RepID=UPI0031F9D155